MKLFYISFVRPLLEYAPVWDPYLMKHIEAIESVQKFATKVCTKIWHNLSYRKRLHMLNLPTLETRHQALKMCYLYKLIHELVFLPNCPIRYRQNCQHDLAPTLSMFHLLIVINTTSPIFVMLHGNGTIYLLFHPPLFHL